jgi:hypothetical protein
MPQFATVRGFVDCWQCSNPVEEQVDFQWGKVPSTYEVGDEIKWLHIGGEQVPSFVLVKGRNNWNSGELTHQRLVLLDCNRFSVDSGNANFCPHCNARISSLVVCVSNNEIESLKSCSPADIAEWMNSETKKTDIFYVGEDGRYTPMPELYDHPIKYVEEFP